LKIRRSSPAQAAKVTGCLSTVSVFIFFFVAGSQLDISSANINNQHPVQGREDTLLLMKGNGKEAKKINSSYIMISSPVMAWGKWMKMCV
jgi:hypothetical protein